MENSLEPTNNLFESSSYNRINRDLRVNDSAIKIKALDRLLLTFSRGDNMKLAAFPHREIAQILTNLLSTSVDETIIEKTSSCISSFLIAVEKSANSLEYSQILTALYATMSNPQMNSRIIANCVRALSSYSKTHGTEVGKSEIVVLSLKIMDKLHVSEQLLVLNIISNVTDSNVPDNMANTIPLLVPMLKHSDTTISKCVKKAIKKIQLRIGTNALSKESILVIVDELTKTTDLSIISTIISIFNRMIYSTNFNAILSTNIINFKKILASCMKKIKGANKNDPIYQEIHLRYEIKVIRVSFKIFSTVLPNPGLPEQLIFYKFRTPLSSPGPFATNLQEFIVDFMMNGNFLYYLMEKGFVLLALIMNVSPFQLSKKFMLFLADYAHLAQYAPYLLLIATKLPHPVDAMCYGWTSTLKYVSKNFPIKCKSWYKSTFDTLMELIGPAATDEIFDPLCLNNENDLLTNFFPRLTATCFECLNKDILLKVNLIMRDIKIAPEKLKKKFQFFASLLIKNLCIFEYETPEDILINGQTDSLLKRGISVDIKLPQADMSDSFQKISIGFGVDFAAVEAYINAFMKHTQPSRLLNDVIFDEFLSIINLNKEPELTLTQIGTIMHSNNYKSMHNNAGSKVDNSGYAKHYFKINDCVFSAYESVYPSIIRALKDVKAFSSSCPVISFVPYKSRRHQNVIENDFNKILIPLNVNKLAYESLSILNNIHRLFPDLDYLNQSFVEKMRENLVSPTLTLGFLVPSIQIVYHLPFLFPFEFRLNMYKIVGFDTHLAFQTFDTYVKYISKNNILTNLSIHLTVDRNKLFEQGTKILENVGPGNLRFIIRFKDEKGFGKGTAQEFFYLFSKEISKDKHKQWRSDNKENDSPDDTVVNKNGLFPRPDADPHFFYNTGVLCAKAILMNLIAPIYFNPIFFEIVLHIINDAKQHNNSKIIDINNFKKNGKTGNVNIENENIENENIENENIENGNKENKINNKNRSKDKNDACNEENKDEHNYFGSFFNKDCNIDLWIEKIDPDLARSLRNPEGMYNLPFTYPGIETIELCENGRNKYVGTNNVEEYIRLVKDFTCGSHIRPIIKSFINGFNTVGRSNFLIFFNSEEILKMITGVKPDITINELKNYVSLNGFNQDSPQIKYLFEIITEMSENEKALFFKFITGCDRLPVGGIKNLEPRINIVAAKNETSKSPDEFLPYVISCNSCPIFPLYTSKEIMKEKLILAISE